MSIPIGCWSYIFSSANFFLCMLHIAVELVEYGYLCFNLFIIGQNIEMCVVIIVVEWLKMWQQLWTSQRPSNVKRFQTFFLRVCVSKAGWSVDIQARRIVFWEELNNSMCVEVPFCKIVTTTTIAVCCISWLMLKLHEFRPLVKVNQARVCIEIFNICVA